MAEYLTPAEFRAAHLLFLHLVRKLEQLPLEAYVATLDARRDDGALRSADDFGVAAFTPDAMRVLATTLLDARRVVSPVAREVRRRSAELLRERVG